MKKYRFYIAWMDGSDGAGGGATGIHTQDDLIPEYSKGNDNVNTWDFECENEEMAYLLGFNKAFFENWTAQDTFSIVQEIDNEACPNCGNLEGLDAIHFDGDGGYQILCPKCNQTFWHVVKETN